MISINPFSVLSQSVPSIAMQLYVVVIIVLVFIGTLFDIIIKKMLNIFSKM